MDTRRAVIQGLCQSDYLDEWILTLMRNQSLFSIKNLKPCEILEDGKTIRSSYWDGLQLLVAYSESGKKNERVDSFAVRKINACIDAYVNDPEVDPNRRLDSSSTILYQIAKIVFGRPDYIKKIRFADFLRICCHAKYCDVFFLVNRLNKTDWVPMVTSTEAFEICKELVESNRINEVGKQFLSKERTARAISRNPISFYSYAKKELFAENDWTFPNMGAFSNYPDTDLFRNSKAAVQVDWLRAASIFIDKTTLTNDIESFLGEDKNFLKKAALSLIALNFEKLSDCFYKHLETFLSDKCFASDLFFLVEKNSKMLDLTRFKPALDNATFYPENPEVMRNHIYGILKKNNADVPYKEEDKSLLSKIGNVSRMMYIVESHGDEERDYVLSQMRGKTPEEALNLYFALSKKSSYFSDVSAEALLTFLKDDASAVVRLFHLFDNSLMRKTFGKFAGNEAILILLLTRAAKLKGADQDLVPEILYWTHKIMQKVSTNEVIAVLTNIDYKAFSTRPMNTKACLADCINETIFDYLNLYIACAARVPEAKNELFSIIRDCLERYDKHKIKAILASFMPQLIVLDPLFEKELADIVFDNKYGDTYPSYIMYSLNGDPNLAVLKQFLAREDLPAYLRSAVFGSEDYAAGLVLFERILHLYLRGDDVPEDAINAFIKSGSSGSLVNVQRIIAGFFAEKPASFSLSRVSQIINVIVREVDAADFANGDADQMIRALSQTVLATQNSLPQLWTLLIKLFDHFHFYISDETLEMMNRYKEEERDNVITIMGKFIDAYDPVASYENSYKEALGLFPEAAFKNELKRWRVAICNKNPDFSEV